MVAKKELIAQLNLVIRDERLYPNRRLFALILKMLLQAETQDEHDFYEDLITAQYITGGKLTFVDKEDQAKDPKTASEAEADKKVKDIFSNILQANSFEEG